MKQTVSFATMALINNISALRVNSLAGAGYIDGSHPVSIYETNGADSLRG
jgi:hypothetical protein